MACPEPIAIIGASCRFPGANNLTSFWKLLQRGCEAITEVPRDRWDNTHYYDEFSGIPGKANIRWAGFLDHIDQFDPAFFGISQREANQLDPQQRLLLEVCWEALEDAAIDHTREDTRNTGVYIGINNSDYAYPMVRDVSRIGAYTLSGTGLSIAANRLSQWFDFCGPSMTLDAACSTSLVTIHTACQALFNGDADMAIAGAVNCILTPHTGITLSQLWMTSPDRHCYSFDERANGILRAEGCGIVILKKLSKAIEDNDPIRLIIRSSAVRHSGGRTGLLAVNEDTIEDTIRQGLNRSGIRADEIDYIEAHGNGIPSSDASEFHALKAVYAAHRQTPLPIGSVKTNIGSAEAAGGFAGLFKVMLAMEYKEIPRHLNIKNSITDASVEVVSENRPWRHKKEPRYAGINSISGTGTIAHLVVEEPPRLADPVSHGGPALFTLTATNSASLQKLTQLYADHLTHNSALRLHDICWTTTTGRRAFKKRLAIIAESTDELIRQLHAFSKEGVSAVNPITSEGHNELTTAARTFLNGGLVDRKEIFRHKDYRRLHLPSHPFQRIRCWLDDAT